MVVEDYLILQTINPTLQRQNLLLPPSFSFLLWPEVIPDVAFRGLDGLIQGTPKYLLGSDFISYYIIFHNLFGVCGEGPVTPVRGFIRE